MIAIIYWFTQYIMSVNIKPWCSSWTKKKSSKIAAAYHEKTSQVVVDANDAKWIHIYKEKTSKQMELWTKKITMSTL